jgi:hypothetical protein
MAKAKTLAMLAGLAGLAYANRDTLFGKKKTYNEDAGDQKTSSYTGDTKKVEATDEPRRKIEDYQKKAPEAEDANYGNEGRRTSMGVSPVSKPAAKSSPKLETITTRKDPREAEAGMSRGTRTPAKPVSTASSSEEGMKNYKPRNTPANPNYSNEGRSSTAPSKVADTVKTVAKTVAQGPLGAAATAAKPLADKATNTMRETYRDLSGKVQYKTPDIPSAAKTASDAVVSGAKKVGSGIADYVKNFETPAERRSREAKEASGMKRGGMVNMASGGMTASRRGDGIAQRGKTRGKMC